MVILGQVKFKMAVAEGREFTSSHEYNKFRATCGIIYSEKDLRVR